MALIKKYSPTTYFLLLAMAIAIRHAKPVFAATEDAQSTTMPEVVVTGQQDKKSYKPVKASSLKYTEPLRNVPQTVTVVPQAVMQEQGSTSLREVLRNVPGISIQAGEGGVPAGDNLSVRGFSARTDTFIDGVRDFGGYSRDSFNFEQIEVAKGPASSYSGRGSTGGSLNLVTKGPRAEAFNRATLGIGTDSYERGTVDINQPLEKIGLENAALRLNGLWHDADIPGRDEVTAERWGVAPSLAFGLETPTRLNLYYYHLSQDNVPDYGIPWVPNTNTVLTSYLDGIPPVDFSNFYGLKARDYEKTVTDLFTAVFEHDFSESVMLRHLVRYGRTDRDSVITAPRFLNTTSTTINRQQQSRDQLDTILASQTDVTWNFETGPIEHAVVSGFEYAREFSKNYLRNAPPTPTADLFNPDPDQAFSGIVSRTGAFNEAISDSFGFYGFDTLKLNEQWDWSAGFRWDTFDLEYETRASNGAFARLERTDETLSWRTGLVYKPVSNGSVYAAYGTSFNPSGEGLSLGNTTTSTNSINVDPEESQTYEVGTKWEVLKEKLFLSAAVFRTDKTNARTEDPTDPTDVIVLSGEQTVDGVELGAAGNVTDAWAVFAAYTYLTSEITQSENAAELGNELSNTPKNTFSLWTTYDLPANFQMGGGVQFIDDRFSANNNARVAPDYWLLDAMVAYKVNEDITIRLNAYNLTDEEYVGSVGGGHFIPGAGRSAMLTTEFDF